MGRPTTRDELLTRIDADAAALWQQIDTVPSGARTTAGACGQWSVKDLLAHGSTWVGSYAVSATTSHYDWARKLVRAFSRGLRDG